VTAFKQKWGEPLGELILNTNLDSLQPYPGALTALERLEIKSLIKVLGAGDVPITI
jgi:hypothetical protein